MEMDKRVTLDYSEDELLESEAKTFQTETLVKKVFCEQYLRDVENPQKNTDICKICHTKLKSHIHARTHYNSANHVKNLDLIRQRLLLIPFETWQNKNEQSIVLNSVLPKAQEYCEKCDVILVGELQVDNHHNDEQHKRNLESYCDICNVKATSEEALLEHQLKFHKLGDRGHVPTIPKVCATTNISPKKSSKIDNKTQTNLPQNDPWYCDVCNKMFETTSAFINHKEVFPHNELERLKNEYIPEIADEFQVIGGNKIVCSLCNVQMPCLTVVTSHLNSTNHIKLFKTKFCTEDNKLNPETNIQTELNTTPETNDIKDYEVNQSISKAAEDEIEIVRNEYHYCYICKMEFASKPEINLHALSFPHVELAKLKSEIVSLGVPYAIYWTQSHDFYCCTLCDAKLFTVNTSKRHFKDPNHKERVTQWCKECSTWKCGTVVDPKYFYCKTCDVALVGTTEAEDHYEMKFHLRKVKFYCTICNVANSTEGKLKEHSISLMHLQKALKEMEPEITSELHTDSNINQQENFINEKCTTLEDPNLLQRPSDISIKQQQVSRELKKLINALYYSKSLPYDVSLEYLRKINNEILELQQKYHLAPATPGKYSDGGMQQKSSTESSGTDVTNENVRNVEANNGSVGNAKRVVFDDDDPNVPNSLNSDTSKTSLSQINGEVCPIKRKRKKKVTIEKATENKYSTENILKVAIEEPNNYVTDNKDFQENNKDEHGGPNENKKLEFETPATFKEILEFIVSRKNTMNVLCNRDFLEVDLLNEIETLINVVNSGDLPFEVILRYLQSCNKDLQRRANINKNTNKSQKLIV